MATPMNLFNARVEKTQFNGWNAYRLTNGIVTLYVTPDIGGRAIQLQLGDKAFFFVNNDLAGKVVPPEQNSLKAGWANYGGDKVWPAPEGWMNENEWPSIPYYTLDGSKYAAEVVRQTPAEVAVRVTSPPDPRTGRAICADVSRLCGDYACQGRPGDAQHQPPADSLGNLALESERRRGRQQPLKTEPRLVHVRPAQCP